MKNNFLQRTITGFFFVVIILAAVWLGPWTFFALLLLICILGLREYAAIFQASNVQPTAGAVVIGGVLVFILPFLGAPVTAILPVLFALFIVELYQKKSRPFERASLGAAGLLYVAASLYLFLHLAGAGSFSSLLASRGRVYSFMSVYPVYSPQIASSVFFLIWATDTFAYLAGRAFGRTPLFPSVSPKKTWEGWAGGFIGALAVALALYYVYGILLLWQWLSLAAVIAVFGTWGDLVESMLKRSLNIKDSGNIIPGHGGILDRFDSLLFAMPFIAGLFALFRVIGQG